MYLLLGDPGDCCCRDVRDALEARGCPVRVIPNPLLSPFRFAWRLDNRISISRFGPDDEPPLSDDQISGVFVRQPRWPDPAGWSAADLLYMQAEMQAALLAWLWSLPCPVVNRYPSSIWYYPNAPLLAWHRSLRRSGLPTLDTLVTNVEQAASAFRRELASHGVPGAVYGPLTSNVRYLLAGDADWSALADLQRRAPVPLAPPHAETQLACVLGETVVWDPAPTSELIPLEPALRRFAAAAGLAFVELAFAATSQRTCVIAVEPFPQLERFRDTARRDIVDGIIHLLTANEGRSSGVPRHALQSIPA